MRSFVLVVSLTALCLGFAGTALGVRPRPVQAEGIPDAARIKSLQARIEVLTFDRQRQRLALEREEVELSGRAPDFSITAPLVGPGGSQG